MKERVKKKEEVREICAVAAGLGCLMRESGDGRYNTFMHHSIIDFFVNFFSLIKLII